MSFSRKHAWAVAVVCCAAVGAHAQEIEYLNVTTAPSDFGLIQEVGQSVSAPADAPVANYADPDWSIVTPRLTKDLISLNIGEKSYLLEHLTFLELSGKLLTANEAKSIFDVEDPPKAIFADGVINLKNLQALFAPTTILIHFPNNVVVDELQASADLNTKAKGILQLVYSDQATKLEGINKLENIRVNGAFAENLVIQLKAGPVYVARKYSLQEIHLFGLAPGEYQIEVDAEATFDGKFAKKLTGKGTLVVGTDTAIGPVVFPAGRSQPNP